MGFVDKQLKLEMIEHQLEQCLCLDWHSTEPRVWNLAERLYNCRDLPQRILVRECYAPMVSQMIECLYQGDTVLLGGSSGTGKSVLGTMVALRLALEGKRIIVYRSKQRDMLVVGNSLHDTVKAELQYLLDLHELHMPSPGVWDANETDRFLRSVLQSRHTIVIRDLDECNQLQGDLKGDMVGDNVTLCVALPDSSQLGFLLERQTTRHFFVPPWTNEELSAARETCYPHLDSELVAKRCAQLPGVSRWVLASDHVDVEREVLGQTCIASVDCVQAAFTARRYEQLPSLFVKRAGWVDLIFQIVPTADWRDFHVIFVSSRVAELVAINIARWIRQPDTRVQHFMQAIADIPTLALFRRTLLCDMVKNVLQRWEDGAVLVRLRALVADGARDPLPRLIVKPQVTDACGKHLEDFDELHPLWYFCPRSDEFKSADGFALLAESLFNPTAEADVYALVAFQISVSPVVGSGLRRVLAAVQAKAQLPKLPARTRKGPARDHPPLKLYLVFVTRSSDACTVQDILTDDGGKFDDPLSVAPQFALSLGAGMDRLLAVARPWEQ